MNDLVYLRPNVVLEPLFSRWYAWLHLISPLTAALVVAHQHLKIMRSFVAQPDLHLAASQNPELIGGPYLHHRADRVPEVQALIEATARGRAGLLELAAAVKSLDGLLDEHPRGMSLEELYPRVPAPLRGFVELGHDLKNQASFRPIEGLLYRSPHYQEEAQSFLVWRMDRDERSFIFSTPRLEEPDNLHLPIPFGDPRADRLAALRRHPAPLGEALELFGAPAGKEALVRSFLTAEPPPPAPRFGGDGVRIRYFGHACLLIESRESSVLTDPAVSYRYPTDQARFTLDDLPEQLDYLVLTHTHADHLMLETLLPLRPRTGTVVVPKSNGTLQDPSPALALRRLGFRRVIEIDEMEELAIDGGSITGLPFLGEHGDLHIRSKLAHAVRLGGRTIVAAADSNALEPAIYAQIKRALGPVDLLFLGMESEGAPLSWVYGPLLPAPLSRKMDQSRRLCGCDARRAASIVDLLSPAAVRIYAMGQEPWLGHVMGLRYHAASPQILQSNELLAHCHRAAIAAERPYCSEEIYLPLRDA